jgi:hypothetical protein
MKYFKSIALTLIVLLASSCNLDLLDDPNAVKLNQTNPSLLLNNIQVELAGFFNTASTFGMQVSRLQNSGGSVYENFTNPQAYDGLWTTAYAGVLTDCDILIKQADAGQFTIHAGMARLMQAYTLSVLVDFFGDVPFSQAFLGQENLNPTVDGDEQLYPAIIAIVDQAIANLRTAPSALAPAITDFYYGGTVANWIRFGNSLRFKLYLNMKNANQALATTGINAVLADAGGLITTQGQNFVFRYATNTADPDVRHPRFVGNYITGAGDYMSNYLMWQMFHGYDMIDPRMRFYFYRQRSANSGDPNEIRCVVQSAPPHYAFSTGTAVIPGKPGLPPGINPSPGNVAWSRYFCYPTNVGYWGRDHVDPQGIPPDGLARTTWGSYPAGGRFDANVNGGVNNPALGMRGAGMQPIMMRSFVNFMRAEAALTLTGTTGSGAVTAQTEFAAGITNALADVRDWSIIGTLGTNPNFGPSPNEAATINGFFPTPGTALANVRVASTGNIDITGGTPATTIDGITIAAGDRVLLKDQSVGSQNGVWIAPAAGAWTRATDADEATELRTATVTVSEGTANATARFVQVNRPTTITVGTVASATAMVFRSPLADEIARYSARAAASYAAQTNDTGRLNLIAREFWISSFCSGIEAYNLYRRTGLPTGMQPTVNPNPGPFPRTFWYPAAFEARNATVDQKPNLTGKVFWDTFSADLDF